MSNEAPVVKVFKVVKAPVEEVFNAWIDPEQRKKWWSASPEHSCSLCEIDGREGGSYRLGMHKDDQEWVVVGEFLEVNPTSKLKFTWSWEHVPELSNSVVTVEFNPIDIDGTPATELVLIHEKLADPSMRSEHNHGWVGCLHSLGTLYNTTMSCDG